MEVDIVIGLAMAATLITFIIQAARILRAMSLHKTLRKAVEAGQPLTAELVDKLDQPPKQGEQDQRVGFVLIALGLAMIIAAAIGSANDLADMSALAAFPLLVGAALLLRLRLNRVRDAA